MKVFVWVGYGSSDVWAADTVENVLSIYAGIKDVIEIMGCTVDDWTSTAIYDKRDEFESDGVLMNKMIKAISSDLDEHEWFGTDSFESGTGFTNVIGYDK